MKKILVGLFVISALGYAKEVMPTAEVAPIQVEELGYNLDIKVGGDLYSNYSWVKVGGKKVVNDETKGLGYELSVELLKEMNSNVEAGLGIAYQSHADRKSNYGIKGASYDSVPLYATVKYKFDLDSMYVPYVKANLGYSFNFNEKDLTSSQGDRDSAKTDDGLYWAIGGGVEYNNFLVELMYGVTKSDAKSPKAFKGDYANDYEKLTLSVGYSFDL